MAELSPSEIGAAGFAEAISRGDDGTPFGFSAAVIAAHPDDEMIGLGGRIHRFTRAVFVHVTDGAPSDLRDARRAGYATREEYARVREKEWSAAFALAGVRECRHVDFGCVDQAAALEMPRLVDFLAGLLGDARPDVVITHPYEGGHPDHDATALAVHAALALAHRAAQPAPPLVEFASYHFRDGRLVVFEFVQKKSCPPCVARLSREERRRKEAIMGCFATQRDVLSAFPLEIESFRRAPSYDFTVPPHAGKLNYERFDWGMTRTLWRDRAARTLRMYGLDGGRL